MEATVHVKRKRGAIPSTSSGVLLSATLLGSAPSSDRPSSFTIQLYKIFIFLVPFLSPYLPPSPSAFINRQPDSDLGPDLAGGRGGGKGWGQRSRGEGLRPGEDARLSREGRPFLLSQVCRLHQGPAEEGDGSEGQGTTTTIGIGIGSRHRSRRQRRGTTTSQKEGEDHRVHPEAMGWEHEITMALGTDIGGSTPPRPGL